MWWMNGSNYRSGEGVPLWQREEKKWNADRRTISLLSHAVDSCILTKIAFLVNKRDEGRSRPGWRGLEIRAVYVPTPIELRRFTSIWYAAPFVLAAHNDEQKRLWMSFQWLTDSMSLLELENREPESHCCRFRFRKYLFSNFTGIVFLYPRVFLDFSCLLFIC